MCVDLLASLTGAYSWEALTGLLAPHAPGPDGEVEAREGKSHVENHGDSVGRWRLEPRSGDSPACVLPVFSYICVHACVSVHSFAHSFVHSLAQ